MVSLLVTFVVGLIVFLPFPSWQQLVGFITSATVLSFASGPLVLARCANSAPTSRGRSGCPEAMSSRSWRSGPRT
jgi:amino acid transporter